MNLDLRTRAVLDLSGFKKEEYKSFSEKELANLAETISFFHSENDIDKIMKFLYYTNTLL